MRSYNRTADEMRPLEMLPGYAKHAEGSCLIKFGDTHVLCTASLDPGVPGWLRGKGRGWVSAEYGMLPRSTHERMAREAARGKQSGRTQEIQRLIGRSLRAVVDLAKLGERQILIDCDVLQADGGTRTAAISGAWVALRQCITRMLSQGLLAEDPILAQVGAVSCGVVADALLLDLDYSEDSQAQTDANFVLTSAGGLIEVQATAEGAPFSEEILLRLLRLARLGSEQIFTLQRKVLA